MSNLATFEEKLTTTLHPELTAKQMAEKIVVAVLESEYGKAFTLKHRTSGFTFSPAFAKMVNVLADFIVTDPELRRQTLSIASTYIRRKSAALNPKA
jgi:hypothetical protein